MIIKPLVRAVLFLLIVILSTNSLQAQPTNLQALIKTAQERLVSDTSLAEEAKTIAIDQLRRAQAELEAVSQRELILSSQLQKANNGEEILIETEKKLRNLKESSTKALVASDQAGSALELLSAEQRAFSDSLSELPTRKIIPS